VRGDAQAPYTAVMPWPGTKLLPLLDGARAAHEAYQERALEESLCVLYVAMTRARHRIDLLVQPAGAKSAPKRSFANVLRHALGGASGEAPGGTETPGADGTRVLWRHAGSSDAWHATCQPPAIAPTPATSRTPPTRAPLLLPAPTTPRRLVREAPSLLAGGRSVHAAELLSDASGLARARGSVMHLWLEQIEWLEDFDPAARRDALLAQGGRLARELGVDAAALPAWWDAFVEALRRPATRALLERSACPLAGDGLTLEVWRERRFALRLPAEASGEPERLLAGSFDRVVLARRGERATGAQLVDHKTDSAPDEAALAARVAHHRPQMEAYRRALVALTGLPAQSVACRLLFLSADRVAEV
jgi:ATP-dependent exoDNAse (exonuclease V) beta subunit